MLVLGVDIGGTFTDLILFDAATGALRSGKVPTVPGNEWQGLAAGLATLGVDAARLGVVVHGTTTGTNAVLEGKGVRTALVTTKGFRDTIEIGRCMRLTPGSLFQTRYRRPAPLVSRDLRIEIDERIGAAGEVVRPLTAKSLSALADTLRAQAPQAIAICLINSFVNPVHEQRIARALRRAGLPAPTYASHEISPEYREYERLSTTVINAAISPILDRYLEAFDGTLRELGFGGALYIMTSNGGTVPREVAARAGAQTILSGPVGGVRGAMLVAADIGRAKLITLDMGGTSTDVALIDGAEPTMASMTVINGFPLRVPQLNIVTVGAGGGSLARLDEGGGIDVGPQSAGAHPGPACYGHGNAQPTVTDANVMLGRLGDSLIGGAMRLQPALASKAVDALAHRAKMAPLHLAEGILEIAIARMANAIREVSVQQGADPREFALFAFGGAGPLHACAVADELGMSEVVIPPFPGHVCAYGLLASDFRRDRIRTWLRAFEGLPPPVLLAELEKDAKAMLALVAETGWRPETTALSYAIDMRYVGQAFEVTVKLRGATEAGVLALAEDFADRHEELYGHRHDRAIEIVNLRVTATAPPAVAFRLSADPATVDGTAARSTRRLHERGRWIDCPVFERDALGATATIAGPAVIEENGSTTYLSTGWTLRLARDRTLILTAAVQ